MSQNGVEPTETSPLISNAIRSIEPGDGLASEGAITGAGAAAATGNGTFEENGQSNDNGLESQIEADGVPKHEGLPEVKKRMKYIFPAVAIGVFLAAADQTIIVSRYVCKSMRLGPCTDLTLLCVAMAALAQNLMPSTGQAGSPQRIS